MLRSGEGVEAESASLRVDGPVYPRRVKHNTVTGGGIADDPRLTSGPAVGPVTRGPTRAGTPRELLNGPIRNPRGASDFCA
jgi:hypothetical protein